MQEVTYPNGDKRMGTLSSNGTGDWTGTATFIESNGFAIPGIGSDFGYLDRYEMGNKWSENWRHNNGSTIYSPEARIYKNVVSKVIGQGI